MSGPKPDHSPQRSALEDYEQSNNGRPPFILTYTEVKLVGIAGVGFFLDAYDLFIIDPVATMLQYRLYGNGHMPVNLQGLLKAAANIGSVIGQIFFGYCADAFGRKAFYGNELILIIIATILCISTPTGALTPKGSIIYLSMFRILLGIGVGGDYPMSASVASDRAVLRKRGTMLAYIFANQGWGRFFGALMTIIVLACYKHVMNDERETSQVDGAWRIIIGVSLIPAFLTLYQRLTLQESTRFKESKATEVVELDHMKNKKSHPVAGFCDIETGAGHDENVVEIPSVSEPKNVHFREVIQYFSEWKHLKILIGTCSCWFLLDITFYGINLNTNNVLSGIGLGGTKDTPWENLFTFALGNIIITTLGFIPGYYVTVLTIEKIGRKPIQFMGFVMEAIFLAILAGKYHSLSKVAFIVNFTLLQFFFNFGANVTTYCYPAEVFPTRYRAFAHGISAACGKMGAITSALGFNSLTSSIGTPAVLWILAGCSLLGAFCTFLLPEVRDRDPDMVFIQELRER